MQPLARCVSIDTFSPLKSGNTAALHQSSSHLPLRSSLVVGAFLFSFSPNRLRRRSEAVDPVHRDRHVLIGLNDHPAAVGVQVVDVDALGRESVHDAGEVLHPVRAVQADVVPERDAICEYRVIQSQQQQFVVTNGSCATTRIIFNVNAITTRPDSRSLSLATFLTSDSVLPDFDDDRPAVVVLGMALPQLHADISRQGRRVNQIEAVLRLAGQYADQHGRVNELLVAHTGADRLALHGRVELALEEAARQPTQFLRQLYPGPVLVRHGGGQDRGVDDTGDGVFRRLAGQSQKLLGDLDRDSLLSLLRAGTCDRTDSHRKITPAGTPRLSIDSIVVGTYRDGASV